MLVNYFWIVCFAPLMFNFNNSSRMRSAPLDVGERLEMADAT